MKNPATDSTVALDHCSLKDKRALVLFLFGMFLLAVDLWPGTEVAGTKRYAVDERGNGHPFVLEISGPLESPLVLLDPTVSLVPEVPARYALFLHQPLAINHADTKSLELLPGVGPHLATAIRQYIAEQGPMAGPKDLQKVAGIGPKTLERLLPLIHFR